MQGPRGGSVPTSFTWRRTVRHGRRRELRNGGMGLHAVPCGLRLRRHNPDDLLRRGYVLVHRRSIRQGSIRDRPTAGCDHTVPKQPTLPARARVLWPCLRRSHHRYRAFRRHIHVFFSHSPIQARRRPHAQSKRLAVVECHGGRPARLRGAQTLRKRFWHSHDQKGRNGRIDSGGICTHSCNPWSLAPAPTQPRAGIKMRRPTEAGLLIQGQFSAESLHNTIVATVSLSIARPTYWSS